MNHFFAIELPEDTRRQVAAFAERWQRQIDPRLHPRWVEPQDYHITLKFLGDVSPSIIAAAVTIAALHAAQREAITIEQRPSVVFPAGKPSVLWIEIAPSYPMRLLAVGLEGSLRIPGVRPEHRPYKPHVTLARCRPEGESGPLLMTEQAFEPFIATRFVLMQTLPPESRENGTKSRYNIVHTFPFGEAAP